MGAGVECNFASFWARERLEPGFEVVVEERFRKSVARKEPEPDERRPCA